jgi:hypothetical protein
VNFANVLNLINSVKVVTGFVHAVQGDIICWKHNSERNDENMVWPAPACFLLFQFQVCSDEN